MIEISDKKEVIKIHTDSYLITGVPFYEHENENDFIERFEGTLSEMIIPPTN